MANHYCLHCGTLLPEDGICLRCGAVYFFSDDGSMIIHPRKVKRVSAKKVEATPTKKRVFAKRSSDPHEADTQTIHIPEDIFSHSDHRLNTENHIDWTGDEDEYIPNIVLKDEVEEDYYEPFEEVFDNYVPYAPAPTKSRKKGRGCALFVLFLVIAILTSVFVFLSIASKDSEKESTTVSTIKTTSTSTQSTTEKQEPAFTASALQHEGSIIGDDRAIYDFDKETGRLTINYAGNAEISVLLLPLIDGRDFTGRHLSLAALFRDSFGLFENELCESDLIKNGSLKEMKLYAEEDETKSDISYQFTTEAGKLVRAYITENYYNEGAKTNSRYTEVLYYYDGQGLVTEIEKKTYGSNGSLEENSKAKMLYDQNGYLKEVSHTYKESDWQGDYKDTIKYSGKQLKSLTPNEDFQPLVSFEYDDNGLLTRVRKITHDPYENTEVYFTYTPTGDIKTVYISGIERGDTYTFSRT